MFRNRKTSQKPDDDLIAKFRKVFPDVVSTNSPGANGHEGPINHHPGVDATNTRIDHEDVKMNDPTPRAPQDLRFSPSFIDPNSYAFMPLANQVPGYYTPNSGGLGAVFHSQAGDLHTPTLGLNMMTPLSLPHHVPSVSSNHSHGAGHMGLENHFSPQFAQQPFQNINPFAQQPSYAPSAFLHHRDSCYDPMDPSCDESSLNEMDLHVNPTAQFTPATSAFVDRTDISGLEGERFRFNVTLRAPTAMIKHPAEIPITYLNKGQAYLLSVIDLAPPPLPVAASQPVRYRTYIRVSFEEAEQRSKPAACWQLWKEGRGSNEAHQRGGKLLAVEYVDPVQGGDDDQKRRQVQLEKASLDGFCITWSPNSMTGASDCSVSVRFNFLSTDFSHSKGVKGIPVRLCAKTELLSPDAGDPGGAADPAVELSYCKVKLFRDHGAERKLSNDIAHVKKAIEKLKQQIAQAELGGGNFGKRKRGSTAVALKPTDDRPIKMAKQHHRRTWSMDSQSEGADKTCLEDDLHSKLAMMQDMFTSTRPLSVFGLRGEDHDDPDLYPVYLPGDQQPQLEPLTRTNTFDSRPSIDAGSTASMLSPSNSSTSVNSPRRQLPGSQYDSGYNGSQESLINPSNCRQAWSEQPSDRLLLSHPTKVQKHAGNSKLSTGYIEAIDIDPTYRPPAECDPKPIACFYVRFPGDDKQDDYYRAIYLTERTVRDLMDKISEKQKIDPDRVSRVLHVNQRGLRIMVDDDVVRELPDGQDMVAEFSEASAAKHTEPRGYEIKLTY
ncbi:hypothetical protein ASPZODRAFT_12416 [Penicilliopsis zonata CBS 506.65]|uniref:Grh/CP2 DB domain-containing protein n=1 Tax=Penicilliopsis zonata CBS 506.65 TaxID=1073090 RepID=A0A1L9SWM5_9EURO|nr:hypothetical protein ASPZODRAFT_12416 [Penicilliopsis zonata CBS 506.65]OJJ51602.1 hypothetical protein ASPZODRAFT_12416 [Penicilliopsis zonata CBS 506.65]